MTSRPGAFLAIFSSRAASSRMAFVRFIWETVKSEC